MKRIHWLFCLVLISFLSVANTALAQTTGTIVGTTEDVNGAPVSGILVTLGGPALIGGNREVLTDPEGQFRFVGLQPGEYWVAGSATGFQAFRQDRVVVPLGGTVELTLLMEPRTSEEVIQVTAPQPVVDTRQVDTGGSISKEFLRNMPSGRSYQDATGFLPGVDPGAGGGNPTVHGGSTYSNQYLIDGVNTTDASVNTFSANFNFDAVCDVEVQTGSISPEYGNTTGGVINVVTCSGSNEHHVESSFFLSNKSLTMEDLQGDKRNFSDLTGNVNVGGPIIKDRLWYYTSLQYEAGTTQLAKSLGDHPARENEGFFWLAKLTAAPNTHNRLMLLFQADPETFSNVTQDPTYAAEAEEHQDQGGILLSTRWDGLYDPWVTKVQVAYKGQFLDIFPERRAKSSSPFSFPGIFGVGHLSDKSEYGVVTGCLPASARADGETGEGCTENAMDDSEFGHGLHYDLDTGLVSGSSGSDIYIERKRYQFTASVAYHLDNALGAHHEFKVGADVSYMTDRETDRYPGGATAFLDTDVDGDGLADPYSARIQSTENGKLTVEEKGKVLALFALDNWDITDHILFQPGVRVEQATYDNYAGKTVLDFLTVAPRIGFAADPFGDGKTRLHGGYSQLYETGNLFLAQFVGNSLQSHRGYYVGDSETGIPQYQEDPDAVSVRGGPSGTKVDPDLKPMRTDEYQIGVERAVGEKASVDVTYIHRDTVNAWEDADTNLIWNQAGDTTVGSYDGTGQLAYTLQTMKKATRTYDSLEFSFDRQLSDRWLMAGSYGLSFYRGTTREMVTGDFDNPRQNAYLEGYLPDDHRHTIKLQGVYKFDAGVTLAGVYEFQSGAPWSELFFNNDDGDYTNRRSPRGTSPGADPNDPSDDVNRRLPDFSRFDLSAAYSLDKLLHQKLELVANITNLFNFQSVTSVQQYRAGDDSFAQTLDTQKPFQATLGVRFDY